MPSCGGDTQVAAAFSCFSLRIISGNGGGFEHGDQLVRGLEAAFLHDWCAHFGKGLESGLFSSDDLGCCCDWCSATTTLARRAGLFSSDDLGCCCDWCSATTTLARRGFGLRMRGYFC